MSDGEVQRSTRELFPLSASAQMQLKAGLHRQFIDLLGKHAGQIQRYLNSSINLIIYGLTASSELSFAALAQEQFKGWLGVAGIERGCAARTCCGLFLL